MVFERRVLRDERELTVMVVVVRGRRRNFEAGEGVPVVIFGWQVVLTLGTGDDGRLEDAHALRRTYFGCWQMVGGELVGRQVEVHPACRRLKDGCVRRWGFERIRA
jgi:hypothetical protein